MGAADPGYEKFRGKLGESAEMLAACLQFDAAIDRAGERLGVYAFLKTAEDQANSDYQRMQGRYQHAATKAAEAASFVRPEMMAMPRSGWSEFLRSAGAGGVEAGAGAHPPLPAAHALDKRRAAAGDAGEDVRGVEPGLPAAQRRRPEVGHDPQREGRARRAGPLVVLRVPALAEAAGAEGGVSRVLRAVTTPTRTRSPPRSTARCSGTCITPRPATTRQRAEAALFPDNVPVSGLRQPDRLGPRQPAGGHRYYDLRRRTMKLQRHPPLRHLRADPRRSSRSSTRGTRR